ncbi:hypothetical protein B0H17DRAFT_1181809 [Mycena rosella]|uniref:DNA-directed RNA polymerase n=1 Tax=Mycena rosella TaxID=1033263 RepID=A0AAD7D722_MYCRO|nr:hypothetical protein B0H17DRAFT_1181809 [Mycena rosella]
MLIARACRRALRGRGRRVAAPSRPYAAAAVAQRRDDSLQAFLRRDSLYTILPTPLPQDYSSQINDYWFTDSTTQELLSVIDACLHDLYDVPRAKGIFDRLRTKSSAALDNHVVNAMLEGYLNMASRSEPDYWMEAVWELFDATTAPTLHTYALMLLAAHRFPEHDKRTTKWLLGETVRNNMSIKALIADRAFSDDEEASDIIQELSRSALDEAHLLSVNEDDAVPAEAKPVMKDESVPFNLQNLRKHLARVALARRVLPTDVTARQKLLEESAYDAAQARLTHQAAIFEQLGMNDNVLRQPDLQRWMWEWHTRLKARLKQQRDEIAIHEKDLPAGRKRAPVLAPYLSLVDPDKLSMLTIVEIMRLQGSGGINGGMKTARALISVGKAVEAEYKAQLARKHQIEIPNSSSRLPKDWFSNLGYSYLHERRVAAARLMQDNEGWTAPWTQALRSQIGAILVECLMDVAEVSRTAFNKLKNKVDTENQPAFYQSYEYQRGQKLGVIRFNPVVSQRLAKDPPPIHPRHLPMLVKPKPWVNYNEGGYLQSKTHVMRFKDSLEQRSYLKAASDEGQVELVYAGLDVLGSTPWKINRRMFDVVLEVWNSGERVGKMPPEVYDEPEPEPSADNEADLLQRNIHLTRMRAYNQSKAANHSDRCSVNYKIEISRSFINDTFYLPHNVDFRGRAYPIPPHLNHIGDDLSRGLLVFADKKPLGQRGFRWLKIHLSNLYGYDKANFDERAAFTEEHLDDIYDSAMNPLTGRRWWQGADDPWQCLATCMELYSAIESGDPMAYESALPVHQDGTCNGLQHYAALGGDNQGAQQVNLSAGERPSDVYSFVGGMVEKMLEEDAAKGDRFALMLKGKVSRKVVKQTVMTTVYGVTFIGARDQIEKQLKDRKDLPEEECWLAASYLAKRVLMAIGDLFTGAKGIQTWLNLSARLISKSIPQGRLEDALKEHQAAVADGRKAETGADPKEKRTVMSDKRLKKEQMTSVVWTTPLGLPICQPYRKTARKQVFTAMQTVYISDPGSPAEVNSMKQASAFPPNFIHSLDATHMMLTAIECRVQDLTFASVHDSYWTHASSIDTMSEVIRDTFIALHSSDVLGKLEAEFKERYDGYKVPLVALRAGGLVKALAAAGVRIPVTPAQARGLESIKDLLVVTEDADAEAVVEIKEPGLYAAQMDLLEQLPGAEPATEATLGAVGLEAAVDALDDRVADGVDAPPPKRKRRTKKEMEEARAMGAGRGAGRRAGMEDDMEDDMEDERDEEDEQMWNLVDELLPADSDAKAEARALRKKQADAEAERQLMNKFVDLNLLLPPLPAKGSFEVTAIKDSQYFFS